jgi:hypothetical protein
MIPSFGGLFRALSFVLVGIGESLMLNDIQDGDTIAPELVEEQLRRICNSQHFSHSRRYPKFLEYVVSRTISRHQEDLKERTIGIEAFGRSLEYDLNVDPIVRVTAGEVRKRLAQYYYDPEHQAELRIELRSGSYIPEFRFVSSQAPVSEDLSPVAIEVVSSLSDTSPPLADAEIESASRKAKKEHMFLAIAGGALILVVASAILVPALMRRASPYEQFWKPIIASPGQVLITVGSVVVLNRPMTNTEPSPESVGLHPLFADPVALADTIAVSNLQQVLFHYSKGSSIQSSTATTYSDLQKGPVILVSGFNNPWTMRLTDPLRFHFLQTAIDTYEIVDRSDPVHKVWPINTRTSFDLIDHDYALIARFHDPTTEQFVVVAGGIGENGTIAASELLSDRKFFDEAKQQGFLPTSDQNWEAVIETKMINGKFGPPRIVASYSW